MRAIHIKLFRDLWHTWGQALAIAVVIASGIATYVMSISTVHSLVSTRAAFYRDYRFAEIFATAKRAPNGMQDRIRAIPGVDRAETRVVAAVKLSVPGFPDPVNARVISIPERGEPLLNRLHLRRGRLPDPARDDEVVVNEVFAEAHRLQPGDRLDMVIKGRLQRLQVVGIALSPEYVFQINPGGVIPDFKRFGVLWMRRNVLEEAYQMDGGFNDVVLTLAAGASPPGVMDELTALLRDYGGLDAQDRYWQTSHRFLENEFSQLRQMARIFSIIFLGVAAFLLNVVLSRIVSTQRQEIAALKSFGYSDFQVGRHYLQFVGVIAATGVVIGIGAGIWLGQGLSHLYIEYYRFPIFRYELRFEVALLAAAVSMAAAVLATWTAVQRAVRLPPAEAMRPEPPAKYRRSLIERAGLGRKLAQSVRMILRNIERHPVKSAVSVSGIALACAVMVVGTFFSDAVDFMIEVEFERAQRQDITLRFFEPTSRRVLHDIQGLEGVQYAEVYRIVPVRLRYGHRSYRTTIKGAERNRDLNRLLNTGHKVLELPLSGVMLTDHLAGILGVRAGDTVIAEVLEGRRPELHLEVAGLASQYVGVGAYMEIGALNRVMQEDDTVSGAYLKIDPAYRQRIYDRIKEMPRVASSDATENLVASFYETSGEFILVFVSFISTLAAIITFGVVYNSARIALAERAHELASMRVLGFTRGEISFILLGELTLLTLVAIPAGLVIGRMLCWVMILNVQQDIFRVPLIVQPNTYALAATVVIVASLLSSLVVRARLDHLDLVAVLKAQE